MRRQKLILELFVETKKKKKKKRVTIDYEHTLKEETFTDIEMIFLKYIEVSKKIKHHIFVK